MKVCIDISQTVYEGTGSGRYVIELVRALLKQDIKNEYMLFGSSMRRRGVLEKLVADLQLNKGKNVFEYKIYPFPPSFYELVWNKLHILPLESFVGNVDVYHSSDWVEAPSKARRVTTVHDLIPFLFPEYVHPRIRQAHENRWKIIKDEVDCIIVDAEVTKKDIVNRFSVPESKIEVIPLACDYRFFSVGKSSESGYDVSLLDGSKLALHKLDLKPKEYLLSVGTLEPRKNIAKLIKAYSLLDDKLRSNHPLVIVGKKSWSGEFDNVNGVIFTGYVEDVDLPFLYGNARCFIMPSLYEGFGFPVLEAMASGCPVLCSKRSSLPEIGKEFVKYFDDPESVEAIRQDLTNILLKDLMELSLQAKTAYTRAKQFSWEKTGKKTLEVYSRISKG